MRIPEKEVILVCPYCENSEFKRVITDKVTMDDKGEYIVDEVIGHESIEYTCTKCGKDVTNVELKRKEVR